VGSRRNGIWAKGDVMVCRGRHGEVGIVEFDQYGAGSRGLKTFTPNIMRLNI